MRKPRMSPILGAEYKPAIINGEVVETDFYKKIYEESMAVGSSLKEDLAAEERDDGPMAISSSMKEDLARDLDDGPMFGRNWNDGSK